MFFKHIKKFTFLLLCVVPGFTSLFAAQPPFSLPNGHGICYANAPLQCLFQNETFCRKLASRTFSNEIGKDVYNLWTQSSATALSLVEHLTPYLTAKQNEETFFNTLISQLLKDDPQAIFPSHTSLGFNARIYAIPAINMIVVASNATIGQQLPHEAEMLSLIKPVWQNATNKNIIHVQLRGFTVYTGGHFAAYVKHGKASYWCDDATISQLAEELPTTTTHNIDMVFYEVTEDAVLPPATVPERTIPPVTITLPVPTIEDPSRTRTSALMPVYLSGDDKIIIREKRDLWKLKQLPLNDADSLIEALHRTYFSHSRPSRFTNGELTAIRNAAQAAATTFFNAVINETEQELLFSRERQPAGAAAVLTTSAYEPYDETRTCVSDYSTPTFSSSNTVIRTFRDIDNLYGILLPLHIDNIKTTLLQTPNTLNERGELTTWGAKLLCDLIYSCRIA